MTITLAYTNDHRYTEDYDLANKMRAAETFTIEVARLSPVTFTGAPVYRSELLDGGLWKLKSPRRKKQSFTTRPDLVLNQTVVTKGGSKSAPIAIHELLVNWVFARACWIKTDSRFSLGVMTKVVPPDDLTPEAFENILLAQQATVEYETARAL